jgi:Rrf2 family cysteine metabolism transcriptional repressor
MQVSTKGRYGLRLMGALAANYGKGVMKVDKLSESEEITVNYIHVLMNSLKAAGLVRAVRGPNGGYELAAAPEKISAYDVVTALEGRIEPTECVRTPKVCECVGLCMTRELWCELATVYESVLKKHTLRSLLDSWQRRHGVNDYCI